MALLLQVKHFNGQPAWGRAGRGGRRAGQRLVSVSGANAPDLSPFSGAGCQSDRAKPGSTGLYRAPLLSFPSFASALPNACKYEPDERGDSLGTRTHHCAGRRGGIAADAGWIYGRSALPLKCSRQPAGPWRRRWRAGRPA